VTTKVDGTNARLCWDGDQLEWGSRRQLITEDNDNHGFAEWANENIDKGPFEEHFDEVGPVVVFGEFFSADIQKRVAYPEEPQFVVFDVFIGSKYLDWGDVCDVANKLNLEVVEHKVVNQSWLEMIEEQLKSDTIVEDPYAVDEADEERKISEGVVVRPKVELIEPYGSDYGTRLIRKIKSTKFEEVNKKSTNSSSDPDYPQAEVDKVLKYVNENRVFSVLEEMKEQDPSIVFDRELTGDVIKNTFDDMQAESEEELDEEIMNKVAGNEIAQTYFDMLEDGYLP
jgi:hypothetical protein